MKTEKSHVILWEVIQTQWEGAGQEEQRMKYNLCTQGIRLNQEGERKSSQGTEATRYGGQRDKERGSGFPAGAGSGLLDAWPLPLQEGAEPSSGTCHRETFPPTACKGRALSRPVRRGLHSPFPLFVTECMVGAAHSYRCRRDAWGLTPLPPLPPESSRSPRVTGCLLPDSFPAHPPLSFLDPNQKLQCEAAPCGSPSCAASVLHILSQLYTNPRNR